VIVDPREPDPGRVFTKTTEITVKDKANADPYPLTLTIDPGTLKGKIYKLEVVLDGVSHTAPDDLDVLLVGPQGQSIILMSDAGGRIPVVNSRLVFSDSGTQTLRDDGPIPLEGIFQPSNYAGDADVFSGADLSKLQTTLAGFNGTDPNGDWKLYVVDDQVNDTGKFAKGFALRVTTTPTIRLVGGLPDPLVYNEDQIADPSDLGNPAATNPDLFIEDADAGTSAAGLEITKKSNDESKIKAANIALVGAVGAGGFDVTITPEKDQYDESTNLLTSVTVTRKSDGASSTVTWKNVIRAVNDVPTLTRTSNKIIQEDQIAETKFIVVDPVEPSSNDPIELEAVSLNPAVLTNIVLNGVAGGFGGASVKVNTTVGAENTIQVRANKDAAALATVTAQIRITAKDSSSTAPAKQTSVPSDQFGLYTVTITPKNDAPALAAIGDQVITSGQTKIWDVAAGNSDALIDVTDPDDTADIVVVATSSDQSLVKNSSIKVTPEKGGTGKRDLQITAELEKQGDTTITVQVTDKAGGTNTRTFKLSVRPSRERRFEGKNVVINDLAVANPYPSIISVDSLVGDVSNVRVEVLGFAHGYPDDVDMVLVSPGGTKVMLMSDQGGSTPVTNINLTFSMIASGPVPDLGPITSGTYDSGNSDLANDPFAGGPVGPFEIDLAKFNGQTAKGEWKLYVVDDTRQDAGVINSWALYLTTVPRIEGLANQSIKEDETFVAPFTIVEESFAADTFTFGFGSTNTAVVPLANLSVTSKGGGQYEVVGTPGLNMSGQSEITVYATNTFADVVSSKFLVTVSSSSTTHRSSRRFPTRSSAPARRHLRFRSTTAMPKRQRKISRSRSRPRTPNWFPPTM
jgi:subtilisin-like proprotein convertase family protein